MEISNCLFEDLHAKEGGALNLMGTFGKTSIENSTFRN